MPLSASLKRWLLLLTLTLIWGVNWSVMKIGATEMPPLWFRAISLLFGTALIGGIGVARGVSLRLPRGTLGTVIVLAAPNIMIWYSIVTVAVTLLPAGRAAILGFTMPVWAALIGVVLYRERLDARTWLGLVASLASVALLVIGEWSTLVGRPTGVVLMLVAAVSWAWGTHAMRRTAARLDASGLNTLSLTFWMMLVSCPVLFAASAAMEWTHWQIPQGKAWWPIFYNAVLVLAIGNLIWFWLARTMTPVASGLSAMLIPVVGVFSGIALLGEIPQWRDIVALLLVCVAVGSVLVRRNSSHKTPANAPSDHNLQSTASPAYARHRKEEKP